MSQAHSLVTALQGVRILSLAQNLPGPLAVSRLVEAGAAARKVEPPGGDPMRALSPAWYAQLHQQVTVERLDLKTVDGQTRLSALLEDTDLLIASQRPSALARLRLDPDTLAARHPHLRGLTIVGDTRAPETPGHDLTYQATAGLLDHHMPRTLLADLVGAERAVTTALLLLRQAAPAHVRVGLRDALESVAAPLHFGLTTEGGDLGGRLSTYRLYDTRAGRVAVAALEPHFRDRLYAALALPDGADLTAVMRTREAREWAAWAAERDLPIAVVERIDGRDAAAL